MWSIHNKQYDFTNFKHPGGPLALSLARDRDCTELFESYHPFSSHDRLKQILAKYEVVGPLEGALPITPACIVEKQMNSVVEAGKKEDKDMPTIITETTTTTNGSSIFDWDTKSEFAKELKAVVGPILKESGTKANGERWAQLAIMLVAVLICLFPFVKGEWWTIVAFPIAYWVLCVNVYHDASHMALSHDWRVNQYATYLFPWFSSPFTWYHQHIIGHHVYTNLEADPDVHHGTVLWRYDATSPWFSWHKWQSFYFIAVWSVVCFSLNFVFDVAFMIRRSYQHVVKMIPVSDERMRWHIAGRFFAFAVTYIWPFCMPQFSWTKAIMFAIIPHTIFSCCFAFFSQVNHLIEETHGQYNKDWYKHQVITSHSFAADSVFWFIFSGGLNFQIEHHLFPGVNHIHLRKIQPIVQQLCEKHNVPYNISSTGLEAIQKYLKHLAKMAIDPNQLEESVSG